MLLCRGRQRCRAVGLPSPGTPASPVPRSTLPG